MMSCVTSPPKVFHELAFFTALSYHASLSWHRCLSYHIFHLKCYTKQTFSLVHDILCFNYGILWSTCDISSLKYRPNQFFSFIHDTIMASCNPIMVLCGSLMTYHFQNTSRAKRFHVLIISRGQCMTSHFQSTFRTNLFYLLVIYHVQLMASYI